MPHHEPAAAPKARNTKAEPRIIWGAAAIAGRIRRSEDFVRRTLAKLPDTPVRKVGGQFCASEDELLAFFSGRAGKPGNE